MKAIVPLLVNLALASALGCANVAGIGDYKKEGEGGAKLAESCDLTTTCGAGLTCLGSPGVCFRNCFDLLNPQKVCDEGEACLPLNTGVAAVCVPTGTGIGGTCTTPTECAPSFFCARLVTGGDGTCTPYCSQADSSACVGGSVCRGFTTPFVIDGIQYGVCGPSASSSSTSGG